LGWAASKVGVYSKAATLATSLVPGWRTVKNVVTGRPEVVMDPETICTARTVLESRRPGSDEVEMTSPPCQARVGVMRDGQFVVIGACIRLEDCLVAPDHVIGGGDKYIYGRQNCVSLKGKEIVSIGTDLSYVQMTEKELSTIGISVAKLSAVPDLGIYSQIVGPMSKGTTGVLRNDPRSFGRVVYEGTTIAGYSGSAYTSGPHVYGLHQMGGQVNGGYAITFVWARLRAALRMKPESSEDWLLGQTKAGRKIRWDASSGDPDELTICINGLYTVVQRDSMVRAFGRNWENEILSLKPSGGYGDYESGESRISTSLGGSRMSEESKESDISHHQSLMDAYKKLSPALRKKFRNSLNLSDGAKTSNGQVSVLDPQTTKA